MLRDALARVVPPIRAPRLVSALAPADSKQPGVLDAGPDAPAAPTSFPLPSSGHRDRALDLINRASSALCATLCQAPPRSQSKPRAERLQPHYRKCVEDYAGKIRPLSQLLKKEAVWNWTTDCQKAFDTVKRGLTEAPILAVADQDRPFHVEKPASSVGARAPSVEDADSAVASSSSGDVLSADEGSDWSGSSPIASVVDDGDYETLSVILIH
ncbi:hypothetical protein ON010_g5986 [Phytophthora cinnamomi]|nr:hypothetical protein ON010_g5986 [Phytophthora cinnamomi]